MIVCFNLCISVSNHYPRVCVILSVLFFVLFLPIFSEIKIYKIAVPFINRFAFFCRVFHFGNDILCD